MVIILTDSLLSRFNKLNVPLYLHPGLPLKSVQQAYFTGFSAEVNARLSMFAWGWHHEAGIHLLRLMLSGAFDKYPNLQVISGHWGEMLPFWLQRLDDSLPLAATGLSRTLTRTFQEHVYVTPPYGGARRIRKKSYAKVFRASVRAETSRLPVCGSAARRNRRLG
ncbi:TPA: amidohydrolase family protein [Escherichia coli]